MGTGNAIGRPTKLTPAVVGKLTAAFANGFTIEQACIYADINRDTYYEWLKKDSNFSDNMAAAQGQLGLQARKVVAESLTRGDIQTAKWWLEKRDPEFSSKSEIKHEVNIVDRILIQFGLIDDQEAKRITTTSSKD